MKGPQAAGWITLGDWPRQSKYLISALRKEESEQNELQKKEIILPSPFGFVHKISVTMLISVSMAVKHLAAEMFYFGQLRTSQKPSTRAAWKVSGSPAAAGTAGKASRIQADAVMNWQGAAAKPIKRYELNNKWFSLHDLKKSTSTKFNHLTILGLDDTFILCLLLKQIRVLITNRTQTSLR